jgi:choline transport protein
MKSYIIELISYPGDEVKQVRTRVPRSIIITCVANSVMLVIFATILLFYIGPLDDIIDTPLPILWVVYSITGSKTAANIMIALIAVIVTLALFNIFASVSRLVWVFACDNGLPFSHFFAYVGIYPWFTMSLTCVFRYTPHSGFP